MLPGFRILFATTVLAISILVFGLGAAALLRAAHEEFASLTAVRPAQQPLLTPFTPQVPQIEATPVLAMLRIEAPGGTKPLPESLRRDATPRESLYQPPLQAALPLPADDTQVQDDGSAAKAADEVTASAPVTDQAAAVNVQITIVPAEPEAPAAEASAPAVKTPDVKESKAVESAKPAEPITTEVQKIDQKPDRKKTDPKMTELNPIDITSQPNLSPTEASEPLSSVASIERSSEATAFAIEPRPVVKKARRPSARAIALRREAARARAEARTRAQQLQQQPTPFPLFGG